VAGPSPPEPATGTHPVAPKTTRSNSNVDAQSPWVDMVQSRLLGGAALSWSLAPRPGGVHSTPALENTKR
jgi:hypothetical protein